MPKSADMLEQIKVRPPPHTPAQALLGLRISSKPPSRLLPSWSCLYECHRLDCTAKTLYICLSKELELSQNCPRNILTAWIVLTIRASCNAGMILSFSAHVQW